MLSVFVGGIGYLTSQLLPHIPSLDPSVLRDIVILTDEHVIPSVFSLSTSDLCPHVYKHLFGLVTGVVGACYEVFGAGLVGRGGQKGTRYARLFMSKIFGTYLTRDPF